MRRDVSTAAAQRSLSNAADPAQRMGEMFRQAEEMGLTRTDVEAAQRLRPGHYDCLTYWRAVDER